MGTTTESMAEKVGTRATLLVFGMGLGMLFMRMLRGSSGGIVAAAALVAILGAVVVLTVGVRRLEHGDEAPAPSWHDLAIEALTGRGRAFVFFATYLTFLFVAWTARDDATTPRARVAWIGPTLAVVAGLALLVAVVSLVRRSWRVEGIERQVFLESTCIGFFVMVLVAGAYAVFEVLTDAPHLSASVWWVSGVGTWALVSALRSRKLH